MKELVRGKFPKHSLWNDKKWWTELRALFKKACERSWLEDDNVVDNRKSDLSGCVGGILCQKYLDIKLGDALTIAKSMIE
jgi:hypothetical protein